MLKQHDCSLVVFCKRPALGQGKQRLAHTIGGQQALIIAECLLDCALEDALFWQKQTLGKVVLSPSCEQDRAWAQALHKNAMVIPQPDGNLGQRLNQVDKQLRSAGHQRLIFIGSDAPLLTIDDLLSAEQQLHNNDVVLQPADDGGVTMMSASVTWPDLETLPWSSHKLQQALCAACLVNARTVWLLSGSEDVDDWDQLLALQTRLEHDLRPARQRLAKSVAAVVA